MFERLKSLFSGTAGFLSGARTFTINVVFFVLLGVVGWLCVVEVWRPTTVLEPISVPKFLADKGLTGEVVAHRLWEAISAIEERAASVNEDSRFQTLSRQIDVVEPGTGLSIQGLARIVRRVLNLHETRVGGEIVCTWENGTCADALQLQLRVIREDRVSVIGPRPLSDWDAAFHDNAVDVLRITNPYVLAVYFDKTNREAEALATARGIVRDGHPDRDWAYGLLGYLENRHKRYREAIRYLTAALKLARDQSDNAMAVVAYNLGDVYMRANRADTGLRGPERISTAIAYFEQASSLRGDYLEAVLAMSKAYTFRKDYDIADWYARQAMGIDPDNPEGALQLAAVYVERGLVADAGAIYENLRNRHPISDVVILESFRHLAQHDGPDAAVAFLERESARLHDDLDLLTTLLSVHRLTDLDKANADFARLVDLLGISENTEALRIEWLSLLVGMMNEEKPLSCDRAVEIMRDYEARFGGLDPSVDYEATAKGLREDCVAA